MKRTPLTRSRKPMKRSKLSPVGARRRREAEEHRLWVAHTIGAAGGRCQRCGRGRRLEAAHVYSKGAHPALRHHPDNGVAVCAMKDGIYPDSCHAWGHANPQEWIEWHRNTFQAKHARLEQARMEAR